MSDNTVLNPGKLGDVVRDIDKGGAKTQVVTLDLGGSGAENLLTGYIPAGYTDNLTGLTAPAEGYHGNLITIDKRMLIGLCKKRKNRNKLQHKHPLKP